MFFDVPLGWRMKRRNEIEHLHKLREHVRTLPDFKAAMKKKTPTPKVITKSQLLKQALIKLRKLAANTSLADTLKPSVQDNIVARSGKNMRIDFIHDGFHRKQIETVIQTIYPEYSHETAMNPWDKKLPIPTPLPTTNSKPLVGLTKKFILPKTVPKPLPNTTNSKPLVDITKKFILPKTVPKPLPNTIPASSTAHAPPLEQESAAIHDSDATYDSDATVEDEPISKIIDTPTNSHEGLILRMNSPSQCETSEPVSKRQKVSQSLDESQSEASLELRISLPSQIPENNSQYSDSVQLPENQQGTSFCTTQMCNKTPSPVIPTQQECKLQNNQSVDRTPSPVVPTQQEFQQQRFDGTQVDCCMAETQLDDLANRTPSPVVPTQLDELANRTPSPVVPTQSENNSSKNNETPTCREDVIRAWVYFIENTNLLTGVEFEYNDYRSADENAGLLLKIMKI